MTSATLDLVGLVRGLATRTAGRAEATVQADVRTLLLGAPLGLADHDVHLEAAAGDRRRIDVEAGFTVIEVKRDLRVGNVRAEAVEQLAGYVRQRAGVLGRRYVGLLTDGAEWRLYRLTPMGLLDEVGKHEVDAANPDVEALLVWLESVLATQQQVAPRRDEIEARLGARSPSHDLDFADLLAIYDAHRTVPSVRQKRELWAKLLTTALGTSFQDEDRLFVEHTLLVATAEIIAHAVIGYEPTQLAPTTILSGALFDDAQISGVVEQDFFDWLLDEEVEGGGRFVRALARKLARFDWSSVEHDVMKVLYESVIGRDQRYQLGEYYTPDWLAERVVAAVVTDPLHQRVLDPGCGSGTFLFWAARRYLAAAEEAGISNATALDGLSDHVLGVDVHPLAVTFARVTYLLAIGMERLNAARGAVSVPVYLGDSLQWGQEQSLFTEGTLTVRVGGLQLFGGDLRFPESLIADAARFDHLVTELADRATERERQSPYPSLAETFRRFPMSEAEQAVVTQTFETMCSLYDDERDHIWAYYVRNLARPTWLARADHRVDVVLGNPPWLTYNAIASDLKPTFRRSSEERRLWGGARAVRNYDLSALFVVRAVELYLRTGGAFAFVMPYAALSRRQFTGFRGADYSSATSRLTVAFDTPWDLEGVRPHPFPVPSSVVFGRRTAEHPVKMPADTLRWAGRLPARNLDWQDAADRLKATPGTVVVGTGEHRSPYARRFESGAKLNPQVLVVVEPASAGPLGLPAGFRRVQSVRSTHEPWRSVPPLEGTLEQQFVRGLHLGSTILPFRPLEPLEAVVPWDASTKRLLDDDQRLDRYPYLADWWRRAAALWREHGTPNLYSLTGRIDFQRKLTRQLPISPHRVVYTKSGTYLTAARLTDTRSVVGDKLYWATARDVNEARYLTAVLNSRRVSELVAPYQSRGQFGTRDFDLYVWYLPIPAYSPSIAEHGQLADLARQAEAVAAGVELPNALSFQAKRRRVRIALEEAGIAEQIEALVALLLP